MATITKVPNGPLIKKKGPFKGSTLKSGGVVKKAQEGATMTPYMQKRAAQDLVKQKNIRARDSILNRNAAAKGMTRAQVQAQQVADKNKPDAPTCDTNDPNFKSTKCGISKSAAKESKSDWKKKRNGGPVVKKAQSGTYEPMNENTKIKTRSADGNYKLKIKGDKVVERRTLKGFFSGAPRAAGRMKEVPTGLVDKLTKKETENPSKSTVKKPIAKHESINNKGREVAMNAARSLSSPISQLPVQRKSTDTTAVKTKSVMKKGGRVVKAKAGAMIKRADGSMSKRGLWDNIRANKGSGKKPTKQMLVQEKKIKAKSKK